MDVMSVLIFAWCKNHIIYVSFPYVVSASSHSLACLSWSLSSIVEPFFRCLANPVWQKLSSQRLLELNGNNDLVKVGPGFCGGLSTQHAMCIHSFIYSTLAQCSHCHLCLRTLQSRIPPSVWFCLEKKRPCLFCQGWREAFSWRFAVGDVI